MSYDELVKRLRSKEWPHIPKMLAAADAIEALTARAEVVERERNDEGELRGIYLTLHCKDCENALRQCGEGILWCEDKQDPCEECGKEWIKYVRADTD